MDVKNSLFTKPLITTGEARKILAEEGTFLSDLEIEQLVANMTKLASYGLEMAQNRNSVVV